MARATNLDPFRCFRFAPRIGFDGRPMGVSRVDVRPGQPWFGRGVVELESALRPDMIEFAGIDEPSPLIIGVYHITDEFSVDSDPSLKLVLNNVTPAHSEMVITPLDATSSDVLKIVLRMSYDRLTFIFERPGADSVLDKIAAVV